VAHPLTYIDVLCSVEIKSLVNWSEKRWKKEVIVGLERINIVSLKKPVSVPRRAIWAVWPQISCKRGKRMKLG
jgi:hypothetical protein